MKKVLFFDIDGTLLDIDHGITKIPDGVRKEMKRLQDLGYYLFIASGRPYTFISQEIMAAGFDGFVLCNGAHVELNNEIIYHNPLEKEELIKLIRILEDTGSEYVLETKRRSFLNPNYTVLHEFFLGCHINDSLLETDFDKNEWLDKTLKLETNAFGEKGKIVEEYIKDRFSYDSHGTKNAFEIYSKDVSKATGIVKVLEYLDLPIESSYAFGDGLNDLEMIKAVGCGVAMGNALDQLKEVADIVCKPVYENGLEDILRELF